jgi:hypothetical protein
MSEKKKAEKKLLSLIDRYKKKFEGKAVVDENGCRWHMFDGMWWAGCTIVPKIEKIKKMTEKDLAAYFVNELKSRDIPYIHIPNRTFKGYAFSGGLKDLPDYTFPYNGKVYMVELGIGNRHSDRKKRQMEVMRKWEDTGCVSTHLFTTLEHVKIFWEFIDKGYT